MQERCSSRVAERLGHAPAALRDFLADEIEQLRRAIAGDRERAANAGRLEADARGEDARPLDALARWSAQAMSVRERTRLALLAAKYGSMEGGRRVLQAIGIFHPH